MPYGDVEGQMHPSVEMNMGDMSERCMCVRCMSDRAVSQEGVLNEVNWWLYGHATRVGCN